MIGVARKSSIVPSRLMVGTALALSILLVAQPGTASAAVSRTAGGSASTTLYVNTTYHTFSYWISMYSDYGGSQTMRARLLVYTPGSTTPTYLPYHQCTTLRDGYGSQCTWRIAPIQLPSGWYYFRMQYEWYTTAGWQVRYDDGSTDRYLGWRWL